MVHCILDKCEARGKGCFEMPRPKNQEESKLKVGLREQGNDQAVKFRGSPGEDVMKNQSVVSVDPVAMKSVLKSVALITGTLAPKDTWQYWEISLVVITEGGGTAIGI